MRDPQTLYDAVLQGNSGLAARLARSALVNDAEPWEVFSSSVMPAMDEARRRYACSEFFLPERLLACRAMRAAMEPLRPRLTAAGIEPKARVLVMTLFGGLGNVVASLAVDMLEGAGFEAPHVDLSLPTAEWNDACASINADAALLALPIICCPPGPRAVDGLIRRAVTRLKEVTSSHTPRLALVGVHANLAADLGIEGHTDDVAQVVPLVDRLVHADGACGRPLQKNDRRDHRFG
jgi:5-methyltetrahydrofolate--homocysteine methyltransferase